jgi:hypothetical protein
MHYDFEVGFYKYCAVAKSDQHICGFLSFEGDYSLPQVLSFSTWTALRFYEAAQSSEHSFSQLILVLKDNRLH